MPRADGSELRAGKEKIKIKKKEKKIEKQLSLE